MEVAAPWALPAVRSASPQPLHEHREEKWAGGFPPEKDGRVIQRVPVGQGTTELEASAPKLPPACASGLMCRGRASGTSSLARFPSAALLWLPQGSLPPAPTGHKADLRSRPLPPPSSWPLSTSAEPFKGISSLYSFPCWEPCTVEGDDQFSAGLVGH